MNYKGPGRKWRRLNRGTVPAFIWRDWPKQQKYLIRIAGVRIGSLLRPRRQFPGDYHNYAITISFKILSNALHLLPFHDICNAATGIVINSAPNPPNK
jgi:hypothetical protein